FASLLPEGRFMPVSGSMLPGAPQRFFRNGTDRSQRPFAHPQRPPSLTASIPGSTLPACCFAHLPVGPPARSALWLHNHRAVCSARGCFRASNPLPASTSRLLRPLAPSPLPFGVLPPLDRS